MPEMGNELATLGSAAAGHGQFRCRRLSVVVAKVGRWLAFCRVQRRRRDGTGGIETSVGWFEDAKTFPIENSGNLSRQFA